MKTDLAILSLNRDKPGKGQAATLRRYDKYGRLLGEKTGRSAYLSAGSLRRHGISVVVMS